MAPEIIVFGCKKGNSRTTVGNIPHIPNQNQHTRFYLTPKPDRTPRTTAKTTMKPKASPPIMPFVPGESSYQLATSSTRPETSTTTEPCGNEHSPNSIDSETSPKPTINTEQFEAEYLPNSNQSVKLKVSEQYRNVQKSATTEESIEASEKFGNVPTTTQQSETEILSNNSQSTSQDELLFTTREGSLSTTQQPEIENLPNINQSATHEGSATTTQQSEIENSPNIDQFISQERLSTTTQQPEIENSPNIDQSTTHEGSATTTQQSKTEDLPNINQFVSQKGSATTTQQSETKHLHNKDQPEELPTTTELNDDEFYYDYDKELPEELPTPKESPTTTEQTKTVKFCGVVDEVPSAYETSSVDPGLSTTYKSISVKQENSTSTPATTTQKSPNTKLIFTAIGLLIMLSIILSVLFCCSFCSLATSYGQYI